MLVRARGAMAELAYRRVRPAEDPRDFGVRAAERAVTVSIGRFTDL